MSSESFLPPPPRRLLLTLTHTESARAGAHTEVEVHRRGREEMPGSQNGGPRPRPVKAETIHGLARAGDLAGVQRKLRENPALLNDKNPVVRAASVLLFSLKEIYDLWSVSRFLMLAVRGERIRFIRN